MIDAYWKAQCERILKRYEAARESEPGIGMNYSHVTGNLAQNVMTNLDMGHEAATRPAFWLDIYHDLLDEHPAFRRAEVQTERGMFPDAPNHSIDYVAASFLRLSRHIPDEPPFGRALVE